MVPVAYAHKGEDSGSESWRIWKPSGEAHVRNTRFRHVGQRQTQADVVPCGPQEGPGASGRRMLGRADPRPGWAGLHLVRRASGLIVRLRANRLNLLPPAE